MSSIYKIGVNLAMTSNGAQVMSTLASGLMGVSVKANQLQGGLSRVKLAVGGVLAIGAGLAVLSMFKTPLDEAMKFETALARFRQFGLGDKLNADAERFAKSMKVAGSNFTDAIDLMSEAQGVFRESGLSGPAALAGAKLAAPVLAKIRFANEALHPDQAGRMDAQSVDMLRFIEMRGGVQSPQRFNQIADAGYKAIVSSGGNVDWTQLRQFMARGGVAAQGIRDDVLFGKLEPVIGELKGSTAGRAWMTAYSRLQGIVRLPNQVAHELAKNGIWDSSKITWNSMGGIRSFNGNPLRNASDWQSDPVAAYQKYILPMYAKMGLDQNGRNRENALIFGRTGGAFFSLIDRQQAAIANSVNAQAKAQGVDASYNSAGQTTKGRFIAAQKQFDDLMISFGSAVLPVVNKGLAVLNPLLTGLSDWMLKHTAIVKGIAVAVAGFGAALIAAGAVALAIAAGPVALWTAGITALAAVITGFLVAVWDPLTKFWADFVKWLGQVGKVVGDVASGNLGAAASDGWALFHGGAQAGQSAVPAPSASQPIVLNHKTMLDGRALYESQTTFLAHDFGANSVGPARHDPQASLPSPNWGYAP